MITDISEQMHAERDLAMHKFASDASPAGVTWYEPDGTVVYVNEAAAAAVGLAPERMAGRTVVELLPGWTRERWDGVWAELNEVGHWEQDFEMPSRAEAPERIHHSLLRRVVLGGRELVVESSTDVTEERRAARELRRLNADLERRVGERTRDLLKANDDLAMATQAKSAFLANMSHELRTPLNSIIGFTTIVRDGLAGDVNEEQLRQLTMAIDSARHLLELINGLLDLSKVDVGKEPLVVTTFHLADVLDRVRDLSYPMASAKGLTIEVEDGEFDVRSDRRKLEQILINLLSNAVKFTEVGRITVTARPYGSDFLLQVRDTGVGMSPEDLVHVFDEFYQAEVGRAAAESGTGLGLPIASRYAQLLGGTLSAESVPEVGSTFTLRLPMSPGA